MTAGPKRAAASLVEAVSPRWAAELRWLRHRRLHMEFQAIEHFTCKGSTAIDIGAHQGIYTARLARLVGRQGRVHSFEPNPHNLKTLRRVASKRVVVHDLALSNTPGAQTLVVPQLAGSDNTGMGSLESSGQRTDGAFERVSVSTDTLDNVVSSAEDISVAKIDVEGHEHAVIEGGSKVLAAARPSILIEIEQRHRDRPVAETFELLEDFGLEGWAFSHRGLIPLASFDVERDQLARLEAVHGEHVPEDYIFNFLFKDPALDLGRLPTA